MSVLALTLSLMAAFSSWSWAGASGGANPVQSEISGKTCEVYQDRQGIPHIHVSSHQKNVDLLGFACLGFVHGRERSWEMDYFRKTVQGRRSEILGKGSLQSDFFLRLLGLNEKADALFQELGTRYKSILWAYSWGVNAGFKAALKRGVYEFTQLGYEPEEWKPQDSLALILLQSFDQTKRSFQTQLDERNWLSAYGNEASQLFSWNGLPWDTSILKPGEYSKATSIPTSPGNEKYPKPVPASTEHLLKNAAAFYKELALPLNGLGDGPGMGSNNWVLSSDRSKTGNAWLANDPHLKLGRPPFWQWIHLEAGDVDVIGATLPGVPVFASATNRHVSWGVTNSFLPVARVSFVPEKDLKTAKSVRPWIWIRFWKFQVPFFFKSYQKTQMNLPILPLPSPEGKAMVLQWTGYDLLPNDISGLLDLLTVNNVAQADEVFSRIRVPSWNFVFADDRGKIGYRAIGRVPRFEKDPPLGVPAESLSQVEKSPAFHEPLSEQEMPHLLNPSRGYIVTANNRQWPSDSRWSSGSAQIPGFRAFRIEELLQKTKRHDLDSNQKIQCDLQAVDARFLVPKLLQTLDSEQVRRLWKETDQKAIQVMREWNFETQLECTACALFRRWVDHIFAEQDLNTASLYRKLSDNPDLGFKKMILGAFHVALDDVGYNGTHKLPMWGSLHLNFFHHLAGKDWFAVKPIPTPGDEYTVNPGSSEWSGRYFDHNAGASQRMVVELSRPPKVYSVLAGSNQDLEEPDLSDPHLEWQRWARCELQRREFPLQWSKVQAQAEKVVF